MVIGMTRSRRRLLLFLQIPVLGWMLAVSARAGDTGALPTLRLKELTVLGDKRLRHGNQLTVILPLADGKRVLSGARDNTLRLWNLETGEEVRRFIHPSDVWGVSLRPGGKTCISSGFEKAFCEWNLESGQEVRRFEGHAKTAFRCAISPDGDRMISGDADPEAFEWRLDGTAQVVRKQKIGGKDESVYGAAWSADGKRYALGGEQKQIWLWDAGTGACLFKMDGHTKTVYSLAFSPDSGKLASTASDNTVRLWNVADGTLLWKADIEKGVKIPSFSPDGTRIAVGSGDGSVRVLDATDGKELLKIDEGGDDLWPVAYSADGRSIFSGGACLIRRHDALTGKRLFPEPGYDGPCSPLTSVVLMRQTGHLICSSTGDKSIFVMDVKTGAILAHWPNEESISELKASADGSRVFGRESKKLAAWDVASGQQLWGKEIQEYPQATVVSADGKLLFLLDNQKHTILDGQTGDEIRTVSAGDNDYYNTVIPSPDGQIVAGCSSNGTMVLLRLPDLEKVGCLTLPEKLPNPNDKDARSGNLIEAQEQRVEYVRIDAGTILPRSGILLLADEEHTLRQWRPKNDQVPVLPKEEIRKAIGALNDESFAVRQEAIRKLSACDESILPFLIQLKVDGNQELDQTVRSLRGAIATRLLPTCLHPNVLKLEQTVRSLKGHPDGVHWAALEGGTSKWVLLGRATAEGLTLVDRLENLNQPSELVFSDDGRVLYAANSNGTVSVYALTAGGTQ